jgi:hypothetical protein
MYVFSLFALSHPSRQENEVQTENSPCCRRGPVGVGRPVDRGVEGGVAFGSGVYGCGCSASRDEQWAAYRGVLVDEGEWFVLMCVFFSIRVLRNKGSFLVEKMIEKGIIRLVVVVMMMLAMGTSTTGGYKVQ